MYYEPIHENIETLIDEFLQEAKPQEVNNWQGNSDFKGQPLLVIRNRKLCFESGKIPYGEDQPWALDHFLERVSGKPTNPGDSYKNWPYHTDLDKSNYKEEIFSHTYQERFWANQTNLDRPDGWNFGIRYRLGDLNDLINQLCNDLDTRQAYLPIWFPEDTGAINRRVPCTLGYYFYIEDGKLNCNYTIRSCDVYRHLRNDVYFTDMLLQYITRTINNKLNINIKFGTVRMEIYNLHLFVNDSYNFIKKEKRIGNPNFETITVKDIWEQNKIKG